MELKEGQVYKRIKGPNVTFTEGNHYPVKIDENNVPFILSDRGARWYSREIMDECFELVQDEKGGKVMIKKGDIVEVIERDYYGEEEFEVGTTWHVLEDFTNIDSYNLVKVYDSRQPTNEAKLFLENVKKLDLKLDEALESPVKEEATLEPLSDPQADVKPVLINVEDLLHDIDEHDYTLIQLKAYLTGYVKGARF